MADSSRPGRRLISALLFFEERIYPLVFYGLGLMVIPLQLRSMFPGGPSLAHYNLFLLSALVSPAHRPAEMAAVEILGVLQFTFVKPLLVSCFAFFAGFCLFPRSKNPPPDNLADAIVPLAAQFSLLVPLVQAALPDRFVLPFEVPPDLARVQLLVGACAVTAGAALSLWALVSLGQCFAITVRVKGLVTGGPYRFVRHPMYLGEVLILFGYTCYLPNPLNLICLCLLIMLQIYRAKREERCLSAAFPAYNALRPPEHRLGPPS